LADLTQQSAKLFVSSFDRPQTISPGYDYRMFYNAKHDHRVEADATRYRITDMLYLSRRLE